MAGLGGCFITTTTGINARKADAAAAAAAAA
eukprot:CAMPEP_0172878472 /NCGR_PEP_ID=MMETSP1075-20121228/109794_1 /TAXON_ID=2916 /ORGANISM="Ceratium fusus, Strain PA161109" /LENGTH=30 /DNA_ID= /DNA_START= /DNA_END= /DNA_ORIENTATION=